MIKTVLFDMNETLLNLNVLKKSFDTYFEDQYIVQYWFAKLLHSSTVIGGMEEYTDFGKLSEAALESVFLESGKELTDEIKTDILGSFRKLPAYEDVSEALQLLRDNDIKVIAVTNSSYEMVKEQLTHSGLIDLFDSYYSVEAVRKYKPFKEIYHYVMDQENIKADETIMVATHDWDLFGAKKVGLVTAYIKRKEDQYNPYCLKPDLSDSNLIDLAKQIINSKL
ncbi:haloacid dehalogenase type II [Jeotgalibaca sp. MA1X17-3]|uniref:haloacid dehalogenase type II n=1 Tax=Jeotgalibaca sp. MA1X17-3 TaxID=2908211 RepID=UPI001F1BC6DA|nr:haloacid dehalogenase type II [Jeotgalibaca sp. MA1X17-3]UJF16038.1 haloacid dehalogenase type II [Jeotgalibaca sp. MA1X17-3]